MLHFYLDEANSRMCHGKKDVVCKKGEQHQKQLLLDTIKKLVKEISSNVSK